MNVLRLGLIWKVMFAGGGRGEMSDPSVDVEHVGNKTFGRGDIIGVAGCEVEVNAGVGEG